MSLEQILRRVFQRTEGESQRAQIFASWHTSSFGRTRSRRKLEFRRSTSALRIKANNLRHEEHASSTTSKKTIPLIYHLYGSNGHGGKRRKPKRRASEAGVDVPESAVDIVVEQIENDMEDWRSKITTASQQHSAPPCLR